MITDNLIWYAVKKEDLPDAVFGIGGLHGPSSIYGPTSSASYHPIMAAYSKADTGSLDYRPPVLFVLRESDAWEVLSWLRVYSKAVFPLSQFARVITRSDWEMASSDSKEGLSIRTDKWASVVLGEILAQGEQGLELENVPLSRASACFSASIARTTFIHDSFAVTRTCADRLRAASDDPRFVKRAVSVDSLAPIWALMSANLTDTSEPYELSEIVLHTLETLEQGYTHASYIRSLWNAHESLFSDSVEDRVVAFQRLVSEIAPNGRRGISQAGASALLALAAFLVGRSTSHAFLLRKSPLSSPMSLVWYGLIAALCGPRGWDPIWSRLSKGIERQLRMSFTLDDPPIADVCWTEYSWLAQTFSGSQGIADLARLFPRTLSIEVVPGVVCQLRLIPEGRGREEGERRSEFGARELEIRRVLEQFSALSAKARHLLDMTPSESSSPVQAQQALGLDERRSYTKPKGRKAPKRSDK